MSDLFDRMFGSAAPTDPVAPVADDASGRFVPFTLAGASEAARRAARSVMVNNLPGAGTLFTYDLDAGFRLTGLGTALALAGAAYGALRFIKAV